MSLLTNSTPKIWCRFTGGARVHPAACTTQHKEGPVGLECSGAACSVQGVKGRGVQVYYRLYLMRGDRIRDAIEIHAADDESALQKARQRKGALPAELWCRSRRVATFLAA